MTGSCLMAAIALVAAVTLLTTGTAATAADQNDAASLSSKAHSPPLAGGGCAWSAAPFPALLPQGEGQD